MVYYFDEMSKLSEMDFIRICSILPVERMEKLKKYYFDRDRKLCAMVVILLMYGLQQEYGIKDDLIFSYGTNNKPYLSRYPKISFNLSHCEGMAVCGVNTSDIGVDIQDIGCITTQVSELVMHENEIAQLSNALNQDDLFTHYWTLKESYTKYLGEGLNYSFKQLDFSTCNSEELWRYGCYFHSTKMKDKYWLSVCSNGPIPYKRFTMENLHEFMQVRQPV
jgi:4'-phosphopantetheinyl transferase